MKTILEKNDEFGERSVITAISSRGIKLLTFRLCRYP